MGTFSRSRGGRALPSPTSRRTTGRVCACKHEDQERREEAVRALQGRAKGEEGVRILQEEPQAQAKARVAHGIQPRGECCRVSASNEGVGPSSSTKRWPSDDFRATGIFGVAKIGFVLWRFGRRSALDAILQHVPPEAPCLIKHILQACLLYTILESVKRARCMR